MKEYIDRVYEYCQDNNLLNTRRRDKIYRKSYLFAWLYYNAPKKYTMQEINDVFYKERTSHTATRHLVKNVYLEYKDDPYYQEMIRNEVEAFPWVKVQDKNTGGEVELSFTFTRAEYARIYRRLKNLYGDVTPKQKLRELILNDL